MLNSSLLRINLGRNVTPRTRLSHCPRGRRAMVDFHHEWLLEGMQLSASSSRCAYDAHFRVTDERERKREKSERERETSADVASRCVSIESFICVLRIALYNDCITRIKSSQTCCLRRNYFKLRNAIVYRRHSLFGEYIAMQREHILLGNLIISDRKDVPPMAQRSPSCSYALRVIFIVYAIVA